MKKITIEEARGLVLAQARGCGLSPLSQNLYNMKEGEVALFVKGEDYKEDSQIMCAVRNMAFKTNHQYSRRKIDGGLTHAVKKGPYVTPGTKTNHNYNWLD